MRALHVTGNWAGNVAGFKAPLLSDAQVLTAAQVAITGSVSSFVDGQGVTRTNDMAQVQLTGVQVGGTSHAKAGFWIYRDVATGDTGLQFRPGLDANLSGLSGFAGDVNITIPATPDGAVFPHGLEQATGDARAYIKAVIAHAPEIIAAATQVSLGPGAALGQPATLSAALGTLRSALQSGDERFFGYMKSMNVEWLGVSVALHYDSYSDPTVRAHVCGGVSMPDSGGNATPCTFADEDLVSFLTRAHARGFKTYLTLAFETSADLDKPSNPKCGTPDFKMSRWWLGAPQIPSWSLANQCIPANAWWWNPSHPDHAAKVAAFWSSYQQFAVKYAGIAESTGVALYSLGTETDHLFRTRTAGGAYTNHFAPQLQAMVAAVRNVYGGAVTYDQHYSVFTDAQTYGGGAGNTHLFDDLDMDVAGISAYFPLAPSAPGRVMSVAELEAQWERVYDDYLAPIRSAYPSKPIVLTEVGYTDHVDSPYFPASGEASAAATAQGRTQQANILQALFNVNARKGELVSGFFLWGNDYFPGNPLGCGYVGFGLYCNPAASQVVGNAYRDWQRQDAGRVFAWAAAVYPWLFQGPTGSGVYDAYYYRHHANSGLYLGLHEANGDVYLHDGVAYNLVNVGKLRTYLDQAARAGY